MAGKFTNTTYTNVTNKLVEATKGILNNPYYKYSDKKPTPVKYWKQNLEKTTLDEASGLNYNHIGDQSPIKFNKINNFYLYGFESIALQLDVGDFGLENSPIEGTCIILPNTIIPTMGDYFQVDYIKEPLLFRVNGVNKDTLDNGNNIYQIDYALDKNASKTIAQLEEQTVKSYTCVIGNVGTDFNCIIEDSTYELIGKLETAMEDITAAYQIFFDSKVQNFVYLYNGYHVYDPYLIEFMIRNKVLSYGSDYIYVHQGCAQPNTFGWEYTKTLYYLLEHPEEIGERTIKNAASLVGITDINSLFTTRMHTYYQVTYDDPNRINKKIPIFPFDVIDRCISGELYGDTDSVENQVYNLMISFFRNDYSYIEGNLIDMIRKLDYTSNKEYYYLIPINLFIIRAYILHLMK